MVCPEKRWDKCPYPNSCPYYKDGRCYYPPDQKLVGKKGHR